METNLEDITQMTKLEERAEKAEAEREKLIGALTEISDLTLTKAQMIAIARFHLLKVRGIV